MGDLDTLMQRRTLLAALAGSWIANAWSVESRRPSGGIVGASHRIGHLLRDGAVDPASLRPPDPARDVAYPGHGLPIFEGDSDALRGVDVVIVGAGPSGLTAAWRIAAANLTPLVLDLEPFLGGTSTFGTAGTSSHPWGAHYLAAPGREARVTLRLLETLGVVTGYDGAGRPKLLPRVLCHSPQERLFFKGNWHEGLLPTEALDAASLAELARYHAMEEAFSDRVGRDGRPAFEIPVAASSRDPDLLALDEISMETWLDREGFRSEIVRWYVRYAMLDDFGALPSQVSAWAGIHYFASRKARSESLEGSPFLVWPEGNGRLVRALLDAAKPRVRTGAVVTAITRTRAGVELTFRDASTGETHQITARAAILAAPGFVADRLFRGEVRAVRRVSSPWIVANLHTRWPADPNLPWDSVLYEAAGLGYVHAGHQGTAPEPSPILTYYRAFGDADVAGSRAELAQSSWETLAAHVLQDLAPAHPHLVDDIDRIDLMVWGHAMPRPAPGFLTAAGRAPFDPPVLLGDRVAWAHVDQAGLALFEESQFAGARAAEQILAAIGARSGESWL